MSTVTPTKAESQKWQETMDRLQGTWQVNYGKMRYLHRKLAGVKSTQIGALVMMLIKMGIIK